MNLTPCNAAYESSSTEVFNKNSATIGSVKVEDFKSLLLEYRG